MPERRLRPLSAEQVREPLRLLLAARPPKRVPSGAGTASAVLIPLFERDGETHTWLVRRADGMRNHSGQVAFPGGKCDEGDASELATALREAEEEIGLAQTKVDVLGRLDDLVTVTGFTIAPFVGWVREPAEAPVANAAEVARVFAAPLHTFLASPKGIPPFRGYKVDGELVWGATAAIARGLVALVREILGEGATR